MGLVDTLPDLPVKLLETKAAEIVPVMLEIKQTIAFDYRHGRKQM